MSGPPSARGLLEQQARETRRTKRTAENRNGSRTLSVGAERVPSLGEGESEQDASNMVAVHARQGLQPLDEQDQSSGDIREIRNRDGHDIKVMIKPPIHSRERQKLVAAQILKYLIPGCVRFLAQHVSAISVSINGCRGLDDGDGWRTFLRPRHQASTR